MNLDDLQEDVGSWATENFGNQPPAYPLVGATEELGELAEAYIRLYSGVKNPGLDKQMLLALELQAAVGRLNHSILKRTQGIREDESDVGPDAEVQALKQIQRITEELGEIHDRTYSGQEIDLMAVPDPDEELIDAVADTTIYLADFSYRANLELGSAVKYTWLDTVSERDWDSDIGGER